MIMMTMMMKIIKRGAVEPVGSSQLNDALSIEAGSTAGQNATGSTAYRHRSLARAGGWLASMSFGDKRLEQMYDRYVVKFGDYSVNMLIVLMSLGCLTESHDYRRPLVCPSRANHLIHACQRVDLGCLTELILYFVAGSASDHLVTAVLLTSLLVVLIFTLVTPPHLILFQDKWSKEF